MRKGLTYAICGIGGFVLCISAFKNYAEARYYQGRIDACEELQEELIKIQDELNACRKKVEEL